MDIMDTHIMKSFDSHIEINGVIKKMEKFSS